jgi:hypothetical protein
MYNLDRHLKTSKKCLSIQDDDTEEVLYNTCQFCNKKFTRKCSLVRHLTTCKKNIDVLIKKQVDEQLKQILTSSIISNDHSYITNSHNTTRNTTNSHNTYNININGDRFNELQVFDIDIIKEKIYQQITEEIIKSGINNTANHVANTISPYVITNDLARQVLIIKDKDLKPNKKDASQLSNNVLKSCSDGLLGLCNNSLETEMKKPTNTLFDMYNVKRRNNILMVRANLYDNQKDNINELCKKTAQYLSKKAYYNSDIQIDDMDEEEIEINRPIESDMLYDGSDTE